MNLTGMKVLFRRIKEQGYVMGYTCEAFGCIAQGRTRNEALTRLERKIMIVRANIDLANGEQVPVTETPAIPFPGLVNVFWTVAPQGARLI